MMQSFVRTRVNRDLPTDPATAYAPWGVGCSGFPIEYLPTGDKVEWVPAAYLGIDEEEDGDLEYALISRRSDASVERAFGEHREQLWRHCVRSYLSYLSLGYEDGSGPTPEDEAEKLEYEAYLPLVEEVEARFGLLPYNVDQDDFDLGVMMGRLDAFNWILGGEWDAVLDDSSVIDDEPPKSFEFRRKQTIIDDEGGRISVEGDRYGYAAGECACCFPEVLLSRNDAVILERLEELGDKHYWNRCRGWLYNDEAGLENLAPSLKVHMNSKMAAAEEKYGRENLGWSDGDWGVLQGRRSAFQWLFGMSWDESFDS